MHDYHSPQIREPPSQAVGFLGADQFQKAFFEPTEQLQEEAFG